jgi:hypothetical protein
VFVCVHVGWPVDSSSWDIRVVTPVQLFNLTCVQQDEQRQELPSGNGTSLLSSCQNWYCLILFLLIVLNTQFYIHGSVHRDSIIIRSNKMKQYAGIYLLQNYSTCFGCLSHPSSGAHQTVTAASGTGHSVRATTFCPRGLIRPPWRKVVALTREMTCTRSCSYSVMYWWWVR